MTTTPPPSPVDPSSSWKHIDLWRAVRKAVYTLPTRFESELSISGVLATDLFAFNSSLGATIEEQVVDSLNKLRTVWDPKQEYALYSFERQPQTFPDVVLCASAPGVTPPILMGIELKGWYVLAKEKEPSFRYKVTPAVCAPADLLVVVPWALSKVISGSPQVFAPYAVSARYAAEYKNWYWEHEKGGRGDNTITLSAATNQYPSKSDMISDQPNSDSGGNFGRFARTGAMDEYISGLFDDKLSGIPLWAWQAFLALFTESQTDTDIEKGLERLAGRIDPETLSADHKDQIIRKLSEIGDLATSD